MSLTAAWDAIAAHKEAAFRVESSISVREQYKTKLRVLIDALLPSSRPSRAIAATQPLSNGQPGGSAPSSPLRATTDASKKKQTRDAVADRLRVRATMPAGKELQVVGDWLLLLRAASVNVVESVAHWRHVIHQDRPLPYEVGHVNYLLQMAHDTDFLDQCEDLVVWLGFRLVRNPFIVAGGLDGNTPNVVDTLLVPPEKSAGRKKTLDATTARPVPPSILVKPLVSITLEDDVVDGSRIERAQAVVTDEEALCGRMRVSQLVEAYLAKPLEILLLHVGDNDDDDQQNGQAGRTIFDAIAALSKRLRQSEHRLLCLLRERTRVVDLAKLIEDQMRSTTAHRKQDLVIDHRVWQYRDKCRASTLHFSESARDQLTMRLEMLRTALVKSQDLVSNQKQQLDQFVTAKERTRQQRQEEKRRVEAAKIERRTEAIRHKTVERNRTFKAKRVKKNADADEDAMPPALTLQSERTTDEHLVEEIAMTLGAPANPVDRRIELDHKRVENLERREQQRLQNEQTLTDESREMNRRRDENAQMFLEDRLSWLVEARRRLLIRERLRKERAIGLTATPICSIVQAIGGVGTNSDKKFVVSVYQHRARGYAPDGLRFVAYDPGTSKNLSLLISTREYSSLGYGRTLEGLTAFCQWLCVIYEKRKRQFKLVWSGAPCPPPLRLREFDHALICVHKEGIRMVQCSGVQPSPASFFLTAVYIRTNDPAKLRFVVSPVDASPDVVEFSVTGPELLPVSSLFLRSDGDGGQAFASWLHVLGEECDDNFEALEGSSTNGTRVFSGEMAGVDDKRPTRVHIFDVSSTEYELHIVNHRLSESESLPITQKPIILLKQELNPYRVRLPGSAFNDLMDCIQLEQSHRTTTESDPANVIAHILPSWRACLARYVRAIRMAKFGCKVDGVFHFVVVTLVQQKTEFRAHLLFELAPIREAGSRYSLRISLSQFLRCPDANVQFGRCKYVDLVERSRTCHECLENHRRSTAVTYADSLHAQSMDVGSNSEEHHGPCSACDATQTTRLTILRNLIESGTLESESAVATMYYAVCSTCKAMPPPIAVMIPTRANQTGADEGDEHEALFSHYFACFDEAADFIDDGATIIRDTLKQSRLCLIRVAAATIGTHSNAVSTAERLRQFLHLEQTSGLSVTVAVVYRELDIFGLEVGHEKVEDGRDPSSGMVLEQALRGTAASILQVGELMPIVIDEADDEQESIANFEAYLVSEALLVEATRVILQPYAEWRLPGETVGASSWNTACEFLRDPQQLSRDLQDCHKTILAMNPYARNILEAYTAHLKWPTCLSDVRAPFQVLLSCVLHIVYALRLLDLAGGLFSAESHRLANCAPANLVDEGIYALEHGAKAIVIGPQRAQANCEKPLRQVTPTDFIE